MKLLLACLISTLSYSLASAQSSNAIPDTTSKEPYATFGSMWGINTGLYVDFNDTKLGGRVTAFYRYGLSNEWWQVAYVQSEIGIDYLPASIGGVVGGVWTNKIHLFLFDAGFSSAYGRSVHPTVQVPEPKSTWTFRYEFGVSLGNLHLGIYGPIGQKTSEVMGATAFGGFIATYSIPIQRW